MKSIKYNLAFLTIAVFIFVQTGNAQTKVSDKDVPNFAQINENLYRGAQPTENGVKELAKLGVKTIVNLRGEDKNSLREKKWAQKAGIKFIAVDLKNWFKPKTEDIEQIIKYIDTTEISRFLSIADAVRTEQERLSLFIAFRTMIGRRNRRLTKPKSSISVGGSFG